MRLASIFKGALVAALMLPAVALPQTATVVSFPIVSNYDVQSASFIYPLYDPMRDGSGGGLVRTVGSSTNVIAANGTPFSVSTVGDEINATTPAGVQVRYITAIGSTTSITVNSAVDLSGNGTAGFQWSYRSLKSGTTTAFGWFNTSNLDEGNVTFQIEAPINATSIQVQMECMAFGAQAQPNRVYPPSPAPPVPTQCNTGTFTVGGITARCAVVFFEPWQRCRLGVLADTPTSVNNFSAYVIGRVARQ